MVGPWLDCDYVYHHSQVSWVSLDFLRLKIGSCDSDWIELSNYRTAGGNAAFHNFHNDYAHIADPNERRRLALAEIDKAPFGWYHVRAIVVAGIGFFTGRKPFAPISRTPNKLAANVKLTCFRCI